MLNDIIKQTVSVGIITLLGLYAFQNRAIIYDALGSEQSLDTKPVEKNKTIKPRPSASVVTTSTGGKVRIPKSKRDGQFWTDAKINNRTVKFLVDTGASSVALTPSDAKAAGINPRRLDYNVRISTANGVGRAASVTLKSIKIGTIKVRNVPAIVVEQGLSVSLLGMTYLGQIDDIQVTPEAMILDN